MALDRFSPPVREWFATTFAEPTAAQATGWPAISEGRHTLILAPTGSGKTLAAFLWGLDRLVSTPPPEGKARTRLLYISPLRALAVDVEKNLRAPLAGIGLAAERLGIDLHVPSVGVRTGDTSPDERRSMLRHPPDLLITTPESLYLMLTSSARDTLTSVEAVIIDEIHALAPTKRGAHMALSLERLHHLVAAGGRPPPQRIGLSATQRPLETIAKFLGGYEAADRTGAAVPRPVTIVDAGVRKPLDVEVVVPVDDMGALGEVIETPMSGPTAAGPARRSIWPSIHPELVQLIREHRSTIVFVNARRMAERLAAQLNEVADEDLVKAHHGSLSRERRLLIEDELKQGTLRGLIATSSLELGIDMGAVDLVIQVESPGAVSRGLQRIGRAGHQVGEPSKGFVFPKHRSDLVEATVVVKRMTEGAIESTTYPRNPLDVLCQQVVAASAVDTWTVSDLAALVRGAANYAELSDTQLRSVLDLLDGRFPSEEFAGLKPRIVWDRAADTIRGRDSALRLAVTNPGTIPDRGLFGVFLPDGTRVGELDEEMVYESRPGETFMLGASTWRIDDITFDRVIVTPAPGEPGKMPFWRGDKPGRPLELGKALGEFLRTVRAAPDPIALLESSYHLEARAASNLVQFLDEQVEATGVLPDDRTILVERFRDEIGDWRVCILSPFGAQVHAPWSMALQARLAERFGSDIELMYSDDGIVLRLPEAVDQLPIDDLLFDPDEIEELVVSQLPGTALFASRFREAAGRALLLPKRRPGQRTPLWQQRQRAADLLGVAAKYPHFPLLLEATRECLQDVFDLPALVDVLTGLRSRQIKAVAVDTERASPFAASLLFGWIAVYMYEGDAPLAERRAAALALDRELLADLLGAEELRELIDPEALAELELELQCLVDGRRARSADELHDLLRVLGDLDPLELDARSDGDPSPWIDELVEQRRAIRIRIGGHERLAAAEDAARLRDALGVALPPGLPAAYTESEPQPLVRLAGRFARTHGPFLTAQLARRLGVPAERVADALGVLEADGRVVRGEFRPGGTQREWCDAEVLRQVRRRSLATLRREVEPVEAEVLARFLPEWQGVGSARRGLDALADAVAQLQGAPIVASALETDVLPARLDRYRSADLDELCAAGELVWVGAGPIGSGDGRVRLYFRDQLAALHGAPGPADDDDARPSDEVHDLLRAHLAQRGASFWPELRVAGGAPDEEVVLAALWDLVWAGEVTNDTLAPLRSVLAGKPRKGAGAPKGRARGRPGRLTRIGPPSAAGRWSLVSSLIAEVPSPTAVLHARARQLLDRHGVVTREAVLAEGVEGGFAAVYGVLRLLEERGDVRRGYFVSGLGAAQFALPGAVDRLRGHRADGRDGPDPSPLVLAATDPAQPFGAALAWPARLAESGGRPARAAGALVVLSAGRPLAYLERGGRSLLTWPDTTAGDGAWAEALMGLVKNGRFRSLTIGKIDGGHPTDQPALAEHLKAAGFVDGYRGLVARG